MAKIITENRDLVRHFETACSKFNKISFVTAWAGVHPVINKLYDNIPKIEKSVVGLHFYQTSPDFIERFLVTTKIQYNKRQSTDVFHPKVYLFYNNETEWEAIIGSSNLTGGGFGRNTECNVLLNSKEESKDVFESIKKLINDSWHKSEPIGDFFDKYKEIYESSKTEIQRLRNPLNQILTDITWNDYIEKLIQNDGEGFDLTSERIQTRLSILRKSEKLFSKSSLKDFDDKFPLAIAGLISEFNGIEDWKLFAATNPNGRFYKLFKSEKGRNGISDALDIIPQKGVVTKNQFNRYVSEMRKITNLDDIKTIATRFLAMKRPDVFVCLSSQNKGILNLLGVTKKNIKLDEYWDLVVTPILSSTWYNEKIEDVFENQLEIFRYRAAMLDALYYTN